MSKQQELAYKSMKEFLRDNKGKPFTIWDIENYVREKVGTTRIAPGRSVRDWINDAKLRGRIIEIAPLEFVFL